MLQEQVVNWKVVLVKGYYIVSFLCWKFVLVIVLTQWQVVIVTGCHSGSFVIMAAYHYDSLFRVISFCVKGLLE